MARGKSVNLKTRTFRTQGEAKQYFSSMLARYRPGQVVTEADAADLTSLLDRHNEREEKIGKGIDHFEVMSADFGSQCFCVVRSDGTKADFSYQRCIDRRHT
jgi:hypothetical protein